MPSVNIQFHILFEELIAFVNYVRSRYQLEIELEKFFPHAFRLVPLDADLAEEIKQFGQVDCFWLVYKSPRSKKAEKFMLAVGGKRGKRLAQAQLGAGTNKAKAFEVLKKIAADLKRRTTAGIWLVTAIGNVGYIKNDRISEGATNAARTGKIDLVDIAFNSSFHVDQPEIEVRGTGDAGRIGYGAGRTHQTH